MFHIRNLWILTKVQHVKKSQIMANAEIHGKYQNFMAAMNSVNFHFFM